MVVNNPLVFVGFDSKHLFLVDLATRGLLIEIELIERFIEDAAAIGIVPD